MGKDTVEETADAAEDAVCDEVGEEDGDGTDNFIPPKALFV